MCPEEPITSCQALNETKEMQQMETFDTNALVASGQAVIVKADDAIEMEASDALRP